MLLNSIVENDFHLIKRITKKKDKYILIQNIKDILYNESIRLSLHNIFYGTLEEYLKYNGLD